MCQQNGYTAARLAVQQVYRSNSTDFKSYYNNLSNIMNKQKDCVPIATAK